MADYHIRRKAGALRSGHDRPGNAFHAVLKVGFHDTSKAMCGERPSITWSEHEGERVTCPKCLKRLAKWVPKPQALSESETGLLTWLAESDYSQFGECHGPDLDRLVERGLAQIHGPFEHQSGFIAQEREGMTPEDRRMYRAVSLTEAGRLEAAKLGEIG